MLLCISAPVLFQHDRTVKWKVLQSTFHLHAFSHHWLIQYLIKTTTVCCRWVNTVWYLICAYFASLHVLPSELTLHLCNLFLRRRQAVPHPGLLRFSLLPLFLIAWELPNTCCWWSLGPGWRQRRGPKYSSTGNWRKNLSVLFNIYVD